jgi:hypothetical protein
MSIQEVQRKYEEQLMRLPNVTAVGLGETNGKPVIKVFVTHKVSASELRPEELIPKTLDNYETDVEESGPITTQPL